MELNEELGEVLCDECDGKGEVQHQIDDCQTTEIRCSKCLGHGKLDWVENAMGKKKEPDWVHINNASMSYGTNINNIVIQNGTTSITIGTDGVDFGDVPVTMKPNEGSVIYRDGCLIWFDGKEWKPIVGVSERIENAGLSETSERMGSKGKGFKYIQKVKSGFRAGSDHWRDFLSRMSWVGLDKGRV